MPDQTGVATLYHNLGGLEHAAGNHADGEPLARKSVEISRAKHILQRHLRQFRNKRLMAIPDEEFASVVREHQAMLYRIAFGRDPPLRRRYGFS